jgi:ABC-type branched-subunit amino acid transport system substrate-binding protein
MSHDGQRPLFRLLPIIVLAAITAVLVSACGSSSSGSASSSVSSTDGGRASGSGGETVKVGFIGPVSGPLAFAGESSLQGAEAGVKYLNEGGSESGDSYELVIKDDKGDPTTSAADARQMIGEGVTMLMNIATEGSGAAVQPIINQARVLDFGPNDLDIAEGMSASGEFPYSFGTGPGFEQFAEKQVEYAAKVLKAKKVGEIYVAGPAGEFFHGSTEAAAKKFGVEVVSQSFPESQADVTAQLDSLKSSGAEALLIWTYGTPLVNVAQSLAKIGWVPPAVLTVQGSADPEVVNVLEKQAPEVLEKMYGGVLSTNFIVKKNGELPSNELAKAYVEGMKAVTGGSLNGNAPVGIYAFDAVVGYDRGIAGAGSTEAEAIAKYLSNNSVELAQGMSAWTEEERASAVESKYLGLFRSNSDFSNGTGVAPPGA